MLFLYLCFFSLGFYLFLNINITVVHFIHQRIFPRFPETQDDLEAITNEIKKMANNARNKLKSEPYTCADLRGSFGYTTLTHKYCIL